MRRRSWMMFLLLSLVVVALMPGCKDDECLTCGDPPPPTSTLPFPETADQLVANFKTAYEGMDVAPYRDEVLSPEFTFLLQDQTVEQFGLPDNVFTYEDDVALQNRMFLGEPSSTGKRISSIEVTLLQPQGVWADVPPTDPNFGGHAHGQFRRYDVQIYFHVQGENLQYSVQGPVIFYVTARDSTHDGAAALCYQLLGQQDLTVSSKATESLSWGDVKAAFQ